MELDMDVARDWTGNAAAEARPRPGSEARIITGDGHGNGVRGHQARGTWGGRRAGAGRKPKGKFARVGHGRRPRVLRGGAVLITLEFVRGLPRLDRGRTAEVLGAAIRASNGRFGLELLAHSLHPDHLHLIVRARGRTALSRAMTGLCVRTARALNRLWRRRGTVYADRYEARPLVGARELGAARRAPCAWRVAHGTGARRPSACLRLQGAAPGPKGRPSSSQKPKRSDQVSRKESE